MFCKFLPFSYLPTPFTLSPYLLYFPHIFHRTFLHCCFLTFALSPIPYLPIPSTLCLISLSYLHTSFTVSFSPLPYLQFLISLHLSPYLPYLCLISQANILGLWFLQSCTMFFTSGVVTFGLLPPMFPGRILPFSLNLKPGIVNLLYACIHVFKSNQCMFVFKFSIYLFVFTVLNSMTYCKCLKINFTYFVQL